MSDHRDDQPRDGQPGWPTGSDPDAGKRAAAGGTAGSGGTPNTPPKPAAGPPASTPPPGPPNPPPSTPPGGTPGPKPPGASRPAPPGRPQQRSPQQPPQPPGAAATRHVPPANQPTRAVGLPGRPGQPPRRGAQSRQGPPPGRQAPPERPTDHLAPVRRPEPTYQREPDLLTHRDDDYLQDQQAAEAAAAADEMRGEGPGAAYRPEIPGSRARKAWKWVRRCIYIMVFLGTTVPIAAFYIIYQEVTVPNPLTVAAGQAQPVTIYYADGSVLDKIVTGTRTFLPSNAIPINVRHAAEAAEDKTFETNNGFDATAIIRTIYNQLTGGTGGASTITQEYIKNATGNNQHTISRKIGEIAEAYKMTNTYHNKNDILAAYLNIVYFGRSAYGIESAAKAFYGVTAAQLTPEQAAMLAGMIQAPGIANNSAYELKRFNYVWGQELADHWITQAQYNAGTFPKPIPDESSGNTKLPWDRQLIVAQVFNELQADGWSKQELEERGAQIHTTIMPQAQTDAENSISTTLQPDARFMNGGGMVVRGVPITDDKRPVSAKDPQVKNTEAAALVSVDPTSGGIIAYYGGDNEQQNSIDMADTPHQAGSSFKPYVLAAGLEYDPQQIGLNAVFDGTNHQNIDGFVVANADGDTCGPPCTVKLAMTNSINTVFYKMGAVVGQNKVRDAALQAGIPAQEYDPTQGKDEPSLEDTNGFVEGGIAIGQYPVRPIDQAQGYATLANNGMKIPVHFVSKVTDISGQNLLYQFNVAPTPAFGSDPQTSAAIARTVSDSLTDVAQSNNFQLTGGRPADAKTGTQNYVPADGINNNWNSDAWTVGFTPNVVTAVWFGHYDKPGPIFGVDNDRLKPGATDYAVFGRTEPGSIWHNYMDAYLANQPIEQFATSPADIGGSWDFTTGAPVTTAAPPPPAPSTNPQPSQPQQQPTQTQQQPTNPFQPPTFPGGGGNGGGNGGGGGGRNPNPTCLPLQGNCGGGGNGGQPPG